jgi:RNA polymerase sigma-70 factor, ECF subfamily
MARALTLVGGSAFESRQPRVAPFMDDETDTFLVGETQNGSEPAFACLVRRYQAYAYGVAAALVSDFALAQDIVQESFLTSYRNLHRLRDPERFSSWLHGIVRRTALRARRDLARAERLRVALVPEHGLLPEPEAPDRSIERLESRQQVRCAMQRLSDVHREVVGLHYSAELSYAEIARFLDITPNAVQGRLQRARVQLREELKVVGETFRNEELPEDFAEQVQQLLRRVQTKQASKTDAVRALEQMGASAIDELCRVVGDADGAVQQVAAQALCRIGDARGRDPILRLLHAAYPWNTRRLVGSGLVLGVPGVREALIELVRHRQENATPGERVPTGMALSALSHLTGDSEVIELATCVYHDADTHRGIRGAAFQALWRLLPEEHESLATTGLRDADVNIRRTAAFFTSFTNLAPPIDACLMAFERGVSWWGRIHAATLVLRHGEKGRLVMEHLLETGTPVQRSAAAVAMAEAGVPAGFDVLKRELLGVQGEQKMTKRLSQTLASHYGEEVASFLAEEQASVPDLSRLLWTMARSRAAPGPIVDGLFEDGTPSVRAAALRILARERGEAILPQLRSCLADGRPRKVAQEAFRQVDRLVGRPGGAALPMLQEMLVSPLWTERKAAVCLLRRRGELTDVQRQTAEADEHRAVQQAATATGSPRGRQG